MAELSPDRGALFAAWMRARKFVEWNHADANLSYFLIVGAALFGALTLVSNRIEPKPLPVTQTIGLPPPYKPAPEANAAQNALNFASENRYSNYVR